MVNTTQYQQNNKNSVDRIVRFIKINTIADQCNKAYAKSEYRQPYHIIHK